MRRPQLEVTLRVNPCIRDEARRYFQVLVHAHVPASYDCEGPEEYQNAAVSSWQQRRALLRESLAFSLLCRRASKSWIITQARSFQSALTGLPVRKILNSFLPAIHTYIRGCTIPSQVNICSYSNDYKKLPEMFS